MTTWTVAGQVVGEAGPGLWVRVKRELWPGRRRVVLRLLRGWHRRPTS
jgi:hypothetical protein